MEKIQYLEILKQALDITWKNKFLWFFGFLFFLASLSANLNTNSDKIISKLTESHSVVAFFSLLLFFLWVILFLLRILANAAIIKSANDINLYKQLPLLAILGEAKKYLIRLLTLEFIVGLFLAFIIILLLLPVFYLFALKAQVLAISAFLLAGMIILALMILAYYLHQYASFCIILGDKNLRTSLELSYLIFSDNIKKSLNMGLISIGSKFLLIVCIFLLFMLAAVLFTPFGMLAYVMFAKNGAVILAMVAITIFLVCLAVVLSWYESFLQTAWLLFFQEIAFIKDDKKKVAEKVKQDVGVPNPETI